MNLPRRLFLMPALLFSLYCVALARASDLYREPYRPQFHFTPATNWMNDPNGLVFFEGEYHLFYQYNPFGNKWGHMSWGHAVSPDLTHWQHLPVALQEENDIMIFSGSAVVDWKNTTGFGTNGQPPLVAIYTGHYTKRPLQNEQLAYSNDRGRTWTKYSGNPVLDIREKDFRDPKVFWHEATQRWVMIVAWPPQRKIRLYASPDLKHWTHLSDFGPAGSTKGIWECPDLFPVTLESDHAQSKWVLIANIGSGAPAGGSGCQYFVGDFDGTRFTTQSAGQTSAVEPQGRVLADFDGEDYAGWQTTGDAFGKAPARGALPNQQVVSGFRGRGLVNSYLNGDKGEGTLTSPEFDIDHNYLSFLIGGGNLADKTCLNLIVEGRVVRTATGDADERLDWKSWDVADLRGRKATLQIVDRHTGGWGHINVDQIVLGDKPATPSREPALWADYGRDFYAAVSWSDVPKSDGRRLWLGWMSNWEYAGDTPTAPWRSAMSLPRELLLRQTPEGLRLLQQPAKELRKLRRAGHRVTNASLDKANETLHKTRGALLELDLQFANIQTAGKLGLKLDSEADISITYDPSRKELLFERAHTGKKEFHRAFVGVHAAPVTPRDGKLSLHLFIDTSSVEVFANGGETVFTELMFPTGSDRKVELFADGNPQIERLEMWELSSCWK